MDDVLFKEAKRLPTKNEMLLQGNKTYKDLFEKIVKALSTNVCSRVTGNKINTKKPPKKDQNIIFQFISALGQMHPKEITQFSLLMNFLESIDSVSTIEKTLYMPKTEVQPTLVGFCLKARTNCLTTIFWSLLFTSILLL